jgi:hypothetical protein
MANTYTQFSQIIENITDEERAWLLLNLDSPEDRFSPEDEVAMYKWADEIGLPHDECPYWPDFGAVLEDDKHRLWIYSEESGNLDNVVILVQAFLEKFRPKEVFAMNWAATCSKPRIEEFGGGAIVVSAEEVQSITSFGWALNAQAKMEEELEG